MPKERLIEEKLANEFGVSRTPIRGAIRNLEQTGWVKLEQNKGAFVVAVSPKKVRNLFAVRANLESFAAQEACKNATNDDIIKLQNICERMEECDLDDNFTLRELNSLFHTELYNLSDNNLCISIIKDLWEHSNFFRQSVWYPPSRWRDSIKGHREIIIGMKQKNPQKVKQVILNHINYRMGTINKENSK